MSIKNLLKIIMVIIIISGLGFLAIYFSGILAPKSLENINYSIACAEYGDIVNSVAATGFVEPENEVLLLSPSTSVIKKIRKVAGSHVKTGEIILFLDPEPVNNEIEVLEDQLEVRKNNLKKTQLSSRSTKIDLDFNTEMKKLTIASLQAELADQVQLLEVGGISPAQHAKTKQELVIAEKDLEMVMERNSIRLKQLQADEAGLLLEIKMHERTLEENKQLLSKMVFRAPSDGIILSIHGKEGERVNQMQLLVRMSDLTTFKITGSVDEKTADAIQTGRDVYACFGSQKLPGKVGAIKPLIENNKIQFDVHLQESSHKQLMPNLKIDLVIITQKRDSILRIKNGPALDGKNKLNVFVLSNEKAYRREIEIGAISPEYVEIISGINEGECIIISDPAPFRHLKEITLNQ